jgi:hypothetical protein
LEHKALRVPQVPAPKAPKDPKVLKVIKAEQEKFSQELILLLMSLAELPPEPSLVMMQS